MGDDKPNYDNVPITETPAVQVLLSQLRHDPPGAATDNRAEQTRHYRGVIYLAIHALSQSLAGATVRIMQRRDDVVAPSRKSQRLLAEYRKAMPKTSVYQRDHELTEAPASNHFVKLFERINPVDTWSDLMTDWTIQRNLTGTAMLWARESRLGVPCEMYILPTSLMFPAPATGQYPFGAWWVQPYYPNNVLGQLPGVMCYGGILLDGRSVLRHRMRHPLWRWDGYSPLTAGGVQLDVLDAIDQSRKSAMDNGFNPDAIISIMGADQTSTKMVETTLRNQHGGSHNARKVAVTNGQVKVDHLSTNPKEMDYASGWDQMVKFALSLFGVPPAIAGLTEATSYAQLYASLRQFHTLSLQPMANDIARFLTKHLVQPYDDSLVVQIDLPEINDVEQADRRADMLARYSAISINELRALDGKPPIVGGNRLIGTPDPSEQRQQGGAGQPDAADANQWSLAAQRISLAAARALEQTKQLEQTNGPAVGKSIAFDPQKHPRNHGKFAPKGTGQTNEPEYEEAIRGPKNRLESGLWKFGDAMSKPFEAGMNAGSRLGQSAAKHLSGRGIANVISHVADVAVNALDKLFPNKAEHDFQQMLAHRQRLQAETRRHVDRLAPRVAKVLGVHLHDAQALLHDAIHDGIERAMKHGLNSARIQVQHNGKTINGTLTRKPKGPSAQGPSSAGSLPPRPQVKATKQFLAKVLKSLR